MRSIMSTAPACFAPWRALGQIFALWTCLLIFQGAARAADGVMDKYFYTSDGQRLHYLEAGTGKRTLVLVPGWLMPAAIFERQLAGLSREYRVLAFDPRSQGLSAVSAGDHSPSVRTRDLDELLSAARVGPFVLAGWSLGVLESLDYVERFHPAQLKGLVLIDNSIGEGPPPAPRNGRSFDDLGNPQRRTRYLTDFCSSMFHKPPPQPIGEAVLASALRVPPAVARQTIRQPYPRTYWRDIVAEADVPVLYAITPRLAVQGAALLKRKGPERAQVEIFPEAGHALFVDEADRFNAVVDEFAARAFGM